MLEEYRERLQEARTAGRGDRRARAARPPRSTSASRSRRRATQREELLEQTRRDIEAETRRAIQEIRNEVADLTVLATEKVTRKTLTAEDQQRLVAGGARASSTSRRSGEQDGGGEVAAMEEIAQVYSRCAVRGREGARQARPHQGAAGRVRGRARAEPRAVGVLLLALLLDARRRRTGCGARVVGADPTLRQLPRAPDREPPHAGDLPHPAPVRRALGPREPAAAGRGHERRRARRRGRRRSSRRAIGEQTGPERRARRARSTRTSSAGSCCASATRSSTHRIRHQPGAAAQRSAPRAA